MDEIDKKIISALQKNARLSLTNLSKTINLSVPAVRTRLQHLEQNGFFKAFSAILNPDKFNKEFRCFCLVQFNSNTISNDETFTRFVSKQSEILECHRITGQYEYILKIVTNSAKTMEKLIKRMREEEHVTNTFTLTVLHTQKEQPSITID